MIRRNSATSLFPPLLAAALVALAILASLQYYWVDQVSAGERERREANLAIAAERMREDFNRELARAYLTFQIDAANLRDGAWLHFAERYDRWMDSAPYPGLVRDLYVVEVNQIGRVTLSRFNPQLRRFEDLAWPYEMLPLRRQFERAYRKIFAANRSVQISIEPVDGASPAILVPVARPGLLSVQQDLGIDADLLFSDMLFPGTFQRCLRCPPELYDTPLLAHTIVMLDEGYIASSLVPALARRYFPSTNGPEYNIAVVDRADPARLIYRSDERLTPDSLQEIDAAANIFDISYDDLNALMLASDPRLESSGDDDSGRIAIGVLGRPGDEGEGLEQRGLWRLLLKHREGSLDAAVGRLRTRNLVLSFGTLLMLFGSVAMLLVTTRRAQRLAQQQIDFASAVSHELRTPLAVICSAGENLADGLIDDPRKARQYGLVISNEGRRLTEMVEQVLAFASAQSGRQRHHAQPLDVADLVTSAVAAMQIQLREGGFTVELELPAELPSIDGDAVALRRAVQNLISNAMKYGGEDGWIGVGAALGAGERGAEVTISVSDRGPGIEAADLPRIFEPFYRGRGAVAAQAHGSGLGLSLVRNTIDAHGGRVSVESAPGQGARFSLHLPLPAAVTLSAQQPAAGTP